VHTIPVVRIEADKGIPATNGNKNLLEITIGY